MCGADEFLDEVVVLCAIQPVLAQPDVVRILQQFLVVRPDVEHNRQAQLGVHTGAGGVERELANGELGIRFLGYFLRFRLRSVSIPRFFNSQDRKILNSLESVIQFAANILQRRPARIFHRLRAGAPFHIQVLAAVRAKTFAVIAADHLEGKGQ